MGFSLSWLAFKCPTPNAVLVQLGLTDTGETADYGRAALSGAALPSGWHLVVAKGCDHRLISAQTLGHLSQELEVIACSVEEHVMFASAELWQSGARVWRIEHSSERSRRDLKTSGLMPSEFQEAVDSATKFQDAEDASDNEVDYFFEVPLEIAELLTGFKHDEGAAGVTDDAFHMYAALGNGAATITNRPWWQFWR